MKFIDYNFVSDDTAAKIMESYGYEYEEVVEEDPEGVEEEVVAEHRYLYENDGFAFSLQEGVEEIDGQLYVPVVALDEEGITSLDENNCTLMESVEIDEVEYVLGNIFEDENTGDLFVELDVIEEDADAGYPGIKGGTKEAKAEAKKRKK